MATVVYLVHGTNSLRADWVRRGGKKAGLFAKQLTAIDPSIVVRAVRWSGFNSHDARHTAGQRLADRIRRTASENDRVFIVGHSHGGNVALHALSDPTVASLTAGIACLGTPFLAVRDREVTRIASAFASAAAWLAFIPIIMAAAALAEFTKPNGNSNSLILGWVAYVAFVFWYSWSGRFRARDWLSRRLHLVLEHHQLHWRSRYAAPAPACPVYVASVSFDEAGAWVRFWTSIGTSPWNMWSAIAKVTATVCVLYFVCAIGLMVAFNDQPQLLDQFSVIAIIPAAFVAATFLGAIPAAVYSSLIRGNPLVLGPESVLTMTALEIVPTAAPWWNIPVGSVKRSWPCPTGQWFQGKLRHSFFYDSEKVVRDVVDWVSAQAADKA